jgi:hypothetical protein
VSGITIANQPQTNRKKTQRKKQKFPDLGSEEDHLILFKKNVCVCGFADEKQRSR